MQHREEEEPAEVQSTREIALPLALALALPLYGLTQRGKMPSIIIIRHSGVVYATIYACSTVH